MCAKERGIFMKNQKVKLEFEITSYNLKEGNNDLPSEIKLTYIEEFDGNLNFLSVVNKLANAFRIKNAHEKQYAYYLENIYQILWSEFFDEEFIDNMIKNIDTQDYSKLDVTINELNEQFHLEGKRLALVIGSENSQINGIRFFFHTKEHKHSASPHIHCLYCGVEKIIDLKTLEFINEPFKSIYTSRLAINLVTKYQKSLIDYWDRVLTEGETVEFDVTL